MSIGYRSVYLTLQRLDGSFNFPEEQPKPEIVRLQNIFFTFLVHLRASCRVILDANPIFFPTTRDWRGEPQPILDGVGRPQEKNGFSNLIYCLSNNSLEKVEKKCKQFSIFKMIRWPITNLIGTNRYWARSKLTTSCISPFVFLRTKGNATGAFDVLLLIPR